MKLYFILLLTIAAYGQAVINAPAVNLDATGSAAVRAWMLTQHRNGKTKLAAPVAPGDTSITVESGAGFAVGSVAIIGTEMVDITAKAGAVMTVTRAINGTTAAAYNAGDAFVESKYKSLNNLGRQIIVDTLKQIVGMSATITAPVATAQATATATVETAVQ